MGHVDPKGLRIKPDLDPDHYGELHDEEEEFVVVGDSDEEEEEDDEEDGSLVDTTTTATRTTTATTNGRPLIGILSQPNCWTRRVTHYSSNCSCNCSIICQVCGIWRCKELFVPLSYNEPEESLAKLNCLQIFQLCVSFFVFCLIEFIKDKERDELFSNFVEEKMCCQDVKLITVLQRQRKRRNLATHSSCVYGNNQIMKIMESSCKFVIFTKLCLLNFFHSDHWKI